MCWGRRKSLVSSHCPRPPELRCCLTACTQPAPPDSIGVNTVGALWLRGIWLLGSNSAPGEDDGNMLGGSRAWEKITMPVCELLQDCFKVLPKEEVSGPPVRHKGFIADYLICIYLLLLYYTLLLYSSCCAEFAVLYHKRYVFPF